jgi:(E)-4-hydroxy-3-methylbut-2-enyl-diphosphate synthase
MQSYCASLTSYKRLLTREVKIGKLLLGAHHPIRVQTMTTTDTMNTKATVEQAIRCIEAGAELIRITAPSKNEAENLKHIKDELRKRGYDTPLVADIHFTPNAAEIAARIVEKVRINPGNYVDKKKFEQIEYTDDEYQEEIDRIREKFVPLLKICKEYGTAMRIGTNHGSLSDRIMSRYGDTAIGMVESAMEFLRIARSEEFHNIVLSMKSSNPQVMVQAYRLLISQMSNEFGECYPLHLGVTEAGDGEDGRIKSAIGIGTLLEDGIGDTVRVSLTEDPEFEIPVCKHLVNRYQSKARIDSNLPPLQSLSYNPFNYQRRNTHQILNIGSDHVPVVIADFTKIEKITEADLENIGYYYDPTTDKWNISDAAADFLFTNKQLPFNLPGTLTVLLPYNRWIDHADKEKYLPVFSAEEFLSSAHQRSSIANFVMLDCFSGQSSQLKSADVLTEISKDKTAVICLNSKNQNAVQSVRRMFHELAISSVTNPAIIFTESQYHDTEESLIHFAVEAGALLIDGMGDGVCFGMQSSSSGIANGVLSKINSISFGILQATRTRISKTEYISCPSCGRTLFDLQETTAKIRAVTHHLKGVKIAIMGCIVNGPGEMADADFGYVGSGPGKITLYKGKEVVKRNVNSEVAVEELILLLKENNAWVDAPMV